LLFNAYVIDIVCDPDVLTEMCKEFNGYGRIHRKVEAGISPGKNPGGVFIQLLLECHGRNLTKHNLTTMLGGSINAKK
jgi:hypothetical protein